MGREDEIRHINRMHRVGRRNKESGPRQVIVQFSHPSAKESIVKSRRDLHMKHPSVCVNEDLTRFRAHLLFQARKLKKAKKINYAWSFDGRVMVKDKQNKIKLIRKAEDLSSFNPK